MVVLLLRVPTSAFRVQVANIVGCSALRGGVNPKCRYADPVAHRPRGVRARKPCCMRNGSYTSSSVPGSSPTAAAMVVSPTGPPSNCSMMVFKIRPSMSSSPNSSTSSRFNASARSEEHTSELQSRLHLVCRLLLEKKKKHQTRCVSLYVDCPPHAYDRPSESFYSLTRPLDAAHLVAYSSHCTTVFNTLLSLHPDT